jgi:enoyl-[acyl-carrier protein] reductase I
METKNALIVGIRNEESVCYAIAEELKKAGHALYATYQDETTRPGVARAAEALGIQKLYPYDARKDDSLAALTEAIRADGFGIDLLVHGISYSTAAGAKLDLPLIDVQWQEFTDAIRVGSFSLVELSGRLLDVLNEEAAILTLTLRWRKLAHPGFNVVCAAKAGLDSIVRGLAQSLGKAKQIRVNGISAGFVPTHSLGKVGNTLEILEREKRRSPLRATVRKRDIATLALSILENRSMTGNIYTVDTGVDIVDYLA